MAVPANRIDTVVDAESVDAWAAGVIAEARDRTLRADVSEMATYLNDLLGTQLTAVIAGTDDPGLVSAWARGRLVPFRAAEERLRAAFEVALLLTLAESAETAQAWFMGMNPYLDNRAPAVIVAIDPGGSTRVREAALAYLAHG